MDGLQTFVLNGNVVDLAVAVVGGAAFRAVVMSFVAGVITPLLGLFGGRDFDRMSACLEGSCSGSSDDVTGYCSTAAC